VDLGRVLLPRPHLAPRIENHLVIIHSEDIFHGSQGNDLNVSLSFGSGSNNKKNRILAKFQIHGKGDNLLVSHNNRHIFPAELVVTFIPTEIQFLFRTSEFVDLSNYHLNFEHENQACLDSAIRRLSLKMREVLSSQMSRLFPGLDPNLDPDTHTPAIYVEETTVGFIVWVRYKGSLLTFHHTRGADLPALLL